jgi:hypothetical protein
MSRYIYTLLGAGIFIAFSCHISDFLRLPIFLPAIS